MIKDSPVPVKFENIKYSRVSRRIWNDRGFRSLSRPKPCAAWLLFRLLTAPEAIAIPGVFHAWDAAIAQSLGWPIKDFGKVFEELIAQEMAYADWDAGLVWLPNAIKHNEPANPNIVVSWRSLLRELPECELLDKAVAEITDHLREMGDQWIAAWEMSGRRVSRPAKIPAAERNAVRLRDGDNCRYCAKPVNWSDRRGPLGATYDHVDPAGPSLASNLVVACRSCNSKKSVGSSLVPIQIGSGSTSAQTQIAQVNQEQDQKQDQDQDQEQEQEQPAAANNNRFAMFPEWQPRPDIITSFKIAAIPDWAIPELVARHRSAFVAKKTDIRTQEDWEQSCSKWVYGDWSNPKKRPKKPEQTDEENGGYGDASGFK